MQQTNTSRPFIMIVNDDGIQAPGIRALIGFVTADADVIVVAPDSPQSGKASSITVDGPLHITPMPDFEGARMYAVSGTPVDCVKLGIHTIVPRRPDILLSGINHGSNSASNLIYSGTMGAVMEGAQLGIPSVGFSLLHHAIDADFSQCGAVVKRVVDDVLRNGLPKDVCLNVNIPAQCTPEGIKVVRGGRGHWTDEYTRYEDPHGHPFYWLSGSFIDEEPDNPETDNYWLNRRYATIVPVRPDQSYIPAIETLRHRYE